MFTFSVTNNAKCSLAPKLLIYSKTCVERPLSKRQKISFEDQLSLIAGQKYCRMLQWEHSAILLTFIKLPFVIKEVKILAIILVPLIMTLSRGHTGQIKRTVIMR